jgi:recombination protein RecA
MPRAKAKPIKIVTPAQMQKIINKEYPGAMLMGDDPSLRIEHLPTDILALDYLLGGFARGRHVEIYGDFHVGKTALAFRFIAACQRKRLSCAFIDVAGTFDPTFAKHLGVDLKKLHFPARGQNANRIVDIMEAKLRSKVFDVIVLDDIASLMPLSEEETKLEKGNYGTAQARLMSQALRKLTAANSRTVLVYINQTREAIGSMFKRRITSGGLAMGFYAGTRLEISRIEGIKKIKQKINPKTGAMKDTPVMIGHRLLVRVEKDKTGNAKPYDETTLVFNYDIGDFDPIEDLMYIGRVNGWISIKGKYWILEDYEDEKCLGRVAFKNWLRKNKAIAEELTERIKIAS